MKNLIIAISLLLQFLPSAHSQQIGVGVGGVLLVEYSKEYDYDTRGGQINSTSKKQFDTYKIPTVSFFSFKESGHFFLFETGKFSIGSKDTETTHTNDVGGSQVTGGENTFNFTSSFRTGYSFRVSDNEKISTYLGVGINPQFDREVVEPRISAYKTAKTILDTDLEISANLFIKVNPNIAINLAVPVKIWNYKFVGQRTDNPQIPRREQYQRNDSNEFLPLQFEFKAGLVYRFEKSKAQ